MSKKRFRYDGGLVYSTHGGKQCPNCSRPIDDCNCPRHLKPPKGDGIVRVGRETKGRKGKGVTIIKGLGLEHDALTKLASKLKSQCGSGGTVKEHDIEIQGEHRDKLVALLSKKGYQVKRVG